MNALRKLTLAAILSITALAILEQLVRDPRYRDWHGTILGIPYDFRLPTIERARAAVWSEESDHLLSPHVFGVGWTVNVGRVYALLKQLKTGK